MATWTTVPDASLEPGKPIRSIDALALRDNPVAIAEGASGAPKVMTAALQPPAAGDGFLIARLRTTEVGTTEINYMDGDAYRIDQTNRSLSVVCLVPGVIRCKMNHRAAQSSSASYVRVLKNGVQQAEFSTTSTINQSRQVDVSVAVGDVVTLQNRNAFNSSASWISYWSSVAIYSATPDMAVA